MTASGAREDVAPEARGGLIELRREHDGLWRWRYRANDNHLELKSNQSYVAKDDAEAAARTAYPGVPIRELADGATGASARERGMRGATALAVSALVVAALAGFVAVALAVVVARIRRRVTSLLGR